MCPTTRKRGAPSTRPGHIPGAGFLDLPGELSRQDAPLHFMMLPPDAFAAVMARHGVGDGTRVVLYSRDRIMWATRVWWMLHAMGFDDAAVLDGGFEQVGGRGPPGQQPSPRPIRTRPSRRDRALALFVDKGAVLQAIDDPATCLINTLSEAGLSRATSRAATAGPDGSRAASTCPGRA